MNKNDFIIGYCLKNVTVFIAHYGTFLKNVV